MVWDTDGPCRHKRQRPATDSPGFWNTCEDSDWVINGTAPAFISQANERRAASSDGRYNLRRRVGVSVTRFTQSEECGYEPNFQEQLQENDADTFVLEGVATEDAVDAVHDAHEEDASSDGGSYQDESEESSCNEYHPGEREDEDEADDVADDFSADDEDILPLDLDPDLDLDLGLGVDLDIELDAILSADDFDFDSAPPAITAPPS